LSITITIGEAFALFGTFTELVNDLSAVNWRKHSDGSFFGLVSTISSEVLELTGVNDRLSLDRSLSRGDTGLLVVLETPGFANRLRSGHALGHLGGVGLESHRERHNLGSLLVLVSSEVDINVFDDGANLSVFALTCVSL
jgi:hypothetical protein